MKQALISLGIWLALLLPSANARPPNFIVIVADDLGYGDLACYGSRTIATPRLDRMVAEGARFTDAYAAAPFCSPSRAALLTGRLPARCGLPYVLFPAEHHGLPEAEVTLAELLQKRGYACGIIGKWHLGWDAPFRPLNHGFDEFYGLPYSNDSNEWEIGQPFIQVFGLEPLPLMEGNRVAEAPADQASLTKRYTERAVDFIRQHRERPFFLYLPHTMPHGPQYVSPAFSGRSRGGLYGDCVEELDWSTGVVLDALRELEIAQETCVIFTSDNGAPAMMRGPGKAKAERFPGRSLAGSNGALRGGKGQTYEGGVRVPMIAWWPGRIKAGRAINAPVTHMDLFPSLATLANAESPPGVTLDGHDLSGLLLNEASALPSPPVFHYFGLQLQAVREGRWKLMVKVDSRPEPRPYSLWFEHQPQLFERQHRLLQEPELYDLEADLGESRNVAAAHPDVVARLSDMASAHARALEQNRRPMQLADGPPPPAPGSIREKTTDLTWWRGRRDN